MGSKKVDNLIQTLEFEYMKINKVEENVEAYKSYIAMHNVKRKTHGLKEELRLNITFLEVQVVGVFLRKVEEVFIDLPAINKLEVCNLNHFLINKTCIRWNLYTFYDRQQNYNLLAVNHAPELV